MGLRIGNQQNPSTIYVGNQPVARIYAGNTIVWPAVADAGFTLSNDTVTASWQVPVVGLLVPTGAGGGEWEIVTEDSDAGFAILTD